MGDVVRLPKSVEEFMLCPCQAGNETDPVGFYPKVAHRARGVVVKSLVCMGCGEALALKGDRVVLS